jgi:hypothetical protein
MSADLDLTERNLSAIQKIYAAYTTDVEAMFDHLNEDLVVVVAPGLPHGGTYVGHSGFRDLLAALDKCWVNLTSTDHRFMPHNETVAVAFRQSGKPKDRSHGRSAHV